MLARSFLRLARKTIYTMCSVEGTGAAKRTISQAVNAELRHEEDEPKKQKLDEQTDAVSTIEPIPDTSLPVSSAVERVRGKRLKYAVMMCYNGGAYYGMQIQHSTEFVTVEQHFFDALLKLRLITRDDYLKPGDFWFQRAARTDRGVSAIRQVCSMMLPLSGDEISYTPESATDAINALLPEDIRIFGIKRATKMFDAKRSCDSRTYTYTLPSYTFAPAEADISNFRISDELLEKVNKVLMAYKGTNNYFNFTSGRAVTDRSCARYILCCEAGKPFIRDDVEYLTVKITGQSFMLHQIRKMIGLCIAVVRGIAAADAMDRAFKPARYDIPIAPALGLALNEVHFNYYNKKFEKTHASLTWSEYNEAVEAFREKYIDSVVYETEKNEKSMLTWLETLKLHNFEGPPLDDTSHKNGTPNILDEAAGDD